MAYVMTFILVLGSFSVMTKRYQVIFGVGVSVMLAFAGIRSYHLNSGGPDSWDLVLLFVLLLCNIGLLARGAWMGIKPKQGKGEGGSGRRQFTCGVFKPQPCAKSCTVLSDTARTNFRESEVFP